MGVVPLSQKDPWPVRGARGPPKTAASLPESEKSGRKTPFMPKCLFFDLNRMIIFLASSAIHFP